MANKPRAVRSLWAPEQSHSPTVTVYQMGGGGTRAGAQPRPGGAPVPKSIAMEGAPMQKSLGEWRHSPGGGSVMKGVELSTSGIIPGAGSSFDASGDADVRHDYPAAQSQAQVPAAAHGHQHHSAAAAAGQQGESQAISRPTSSQRGTRASMTSPIPLEPPPYDNLAPPTVDLANGKIRSPNRSPPSSAQRKNISVSIAGDHHHHHHQQQQQQQHVSPASASTQATGIVCSNMSLNLFGCRTLTHRGIHASTNTVAQPQNTRPKQSLNLMALENQSQTLILNPESRTLNPEP